MTSLAVEQLNQIHVSPVLQQDVARSSVGIEANLYVAVKPVKGCNLCDFHDSNPHYALPFLVISLRVRRYVP